MSKTAKNSHWNRNVIILLHFTLIPNHPEIKTNRFTQITENCANKIRNSAGNGLDESSSTVGYPIEDKFA